MYVHVQGCLKGQKKVLGPLELELQVVSELPGMGDGNSTPGLWKRSKCF